MNRIVPESADSRDVSSLPGARQEAMGTVADVNRRCWRLSNMDVGQPIVGRLPTPAAAALVWRYCSEAPQP